MTAVRRSRRRVVVAGVVAVAVLATGALLVRMSRGGLDADNRPERLPAARDDTTDTSQPDGSMPDPAAFQTERGAVTTAVALAAAPQRWLYLTDDEVRSEVAAIATGEARERLTDEVLGDIQQARHDLAASSGRIWWLVQPLAWRVDRFTEERATVSVWFVTILSVAGVAIPQTAWRTGTFDLEWTTDGWWLEAMSDTPGPTPATGPDDDPWNADAFDGALTGFTRLDRAASP